MTKQYLKPLALALAVSFALTACGKHDAASNAPASASTTAAADLGKSIFDVSELGDSALACQDFNGFVNAKRSEEHTSELQSLMRISYAVFCLKKKKKNNHKTNSKSH